MCIATFSLVLYSAPFSDTLDRLPWRTSRIRRVPGVPQLAPVYPGTPARASTRTQLTLPAGLGPRSAADCRAIRRRGADGPLCWRRVRRWSGRAVLSRAHSKGLSAFRTGGAAARSRAVARGRAGAHARRGDRGMYALRVTPSGVRARSNRMRGWRARADRRVHDVHPAGGSPTAGPIARRLSGRAGALRASGARGLGRPCSARRRSPTSW